MEKYWIARASAAIGTSGDLVRKYENFYHFDFSAVPIIPYPVAKDCFDEGPQAPCENHDEILFLGPLELKNGPHVLVQAIPAVLDKVPNAHFVLVGDDRGLRQYCEKLVSDAGLSEKVTFLDELPRDRDAETSRRPAVCVFPALWENLPHAFLEAMAAGWPVVASNVGGFRDIIENGVNGLLVDAGDPDSLAAAVTATLSDDGKRFQFSQQAPVRIRDVCDPQRVAEMSLEIYRGVLGK